MAVGGTVPQYVVDPPTAESVAAVLKFAADHDLAVIPRGNGTKLAHRQPAPPLRPCLVTQRIEPCLAL